MSLIAQALPPVQATQNAGGKRTYGFDVSALTVAPWQANASVQANALVRPTFKNQNGFIYQNGPNAGQSGSTEPTWLTPAGATLNDGSLLLTARVPPIAGQDSIASVTWTLVNPPDATVTIGSQVSTALVATAEVGGGTLGETYEILVMATMVSGQEWPQQIFITFQ